MVAPSLMHVELNREAVRAASAEPRQPGPPPGPPPWRGRMADLLARTAIRLDDERTRRAVARTT